MDRVSNLAGRIGLFLAWFALASIALSCLYGIGERGGVRASHDSVFGGK